MWVCVAVSRTFHSVTRTSFKGAPVSGAGYEELMLHQYTENNQPQGEVKKCLLNCS